MARVRFEDELGKFGELDLAKMKAGDLVKFVADFTKRADDDDTERRVPAGEIAEVLEVYPQMPGLLIEVPCVVASMGSEISGDAELVIAPEDIVMVIDSRDPRTTHNRIIDASIALSPEEVVACMAALALPEACRTRPIMIAALTRANMRSAARVLARATDGVFDFVVRTAANVSDWLPLVLWGMSAFANEFPGRSKPNLKSRRHAAWALKMLHEDLARTLPAHELDWNDEDEANAKLIKEIQSLEQYIQQSTDEQWVQALPKLDQLMEDPALSREYRKWTGLPVEPNEQLERGMHDLTRSLQPQRSPQPLTDQALEQAEQHVQEMPVEEDTDARAREWLQQHEQRLETQRPKKKPQPPVAIPPEMQETLDRGFAHEPGEIVLEEPGAHVAPEQPPATIEPVPDLPPSPQPLPETPSKYDVNVFGDEPAHAPHEWATPPAAPARVPINVPPGYEGGNNTRSVKVWAEPEMIVENRATGQKGAIVGTLPDDRLSIDVYDETGLPESDQAATWNAVDVRLSPEWQFPVRKLTPDEYMAWRKSRHERQTDIRRKKESDPIAPTMVTAAEVIAEDRPFDRVALAPVGVKELKMLLAGKTPFGVLSAYKARSKHQNQESHGDLMAELQRRGYSPGQIRSIRGQYFGQGGEMKAEQSFLVIGMSYRDAIDLGRRFGQESVIWKSPDGVVGAFYTDDSGRANYALRPDGDIAVGEEAAPRIEVRHPKPEHRGPPAKEDPWSKARGTGFEFSIDWNQTFKRDPNRPPSANEAREEMNRSPTVVSAASMT